MNEILLESKPETGPVNPHARAFFWLWGLSCVLLVGFRVDNPTCHEQLDSWHRGRVESLKSETGWLNLVGLFWLKEGRNEAGTDPGHDLTFPADRKPAQVGTFTQTKGTVNDHE